MKTQTDMTNRPGPKFTARNENHTPYNKTAWQIEQSTAILEIVDCPEGGADKLGWLDINVSETTQAKKDGPFQTRTITFCLHAADREKLIEMLRASA